MPAAFDTIRLLGWRRLWRLWRGYRVGWMEAIAPFITTRTLQTLLNVGFFDALKRDGAINVGRFAAEHNLDAEILQALVESMYSLRFLDRRGSDYVLDEKGHIIVEVARGWLDGVYGYEGLYHDLEPLLRKELVYDRDITRRARFVAKGRGHIENWIFMPMAIDALARGNRRRVLDFGCGDAAFLRNLCAANPAIRGVGIDMSPSAIEDATSFVREAGMAERIALAVVDIAELGRTTADLGDVDAATAFFVLHEVLYRGRDVLVNALRGFRTRFPGVPLMAFEIDRATPEGMRRRPGMSVQYNLQHTLSHQTLVDRATWRALFEEAGFRTIDERHIRFARTVVFTVQ